jgi:hypothetical protein
MSRSCPRNCRGSLCCSLRRAQRAAGPATRRRACRRSSCCRTDEQVRCALPPGRGDDVRMAGTGPAQLIRPAADPPVAARSEIGVGPAAEREPAQGVKPGPSAAVKATGTDSDVLVSWRGGRGRLVCYLRLSGPGPSVHVQTAVRSWGGRCRHGSTPAVVRTSGRAPTSDSKAQRSSTAAFKPTRIRCSGPLERPARVPHRTGLAHPGLAHRGTGLPGAGPRRFAHQPQTLRHCRGVERDRNVAPTLLGVDASNGRQAPPPRTRVPRCRVGWQARRPGRPMVVPRHRAPRALNACNGRNSAGVHRGRTGTVSRSPVRQTAPCRSSASPRIPPPTSCSAATRSRYFSE